jgi:2-polyprenyl-3-methyl-5-hydroxy-6-metoxy-1,4-benzoquinol methylase
VKEPAKISNPEYTVDRIVARMKKAAARKGPLSSGASLDVVTSAEFHPVRRGETRLTEINTHPVRLQPLFHPHSDGRYHVNDLLKYHDRTFIQNAYRAILKRGPDATGYQSFIESLRSARLNKIDILARLRYSAEGRAKQVEIEGLRVPALIRRAYRVPVIGYLLNLAVALARLPLLIRSQQQIEAHVLAQQEIIVEHLNHIDRTFSTHAEEVSQVFDKQTESSKALSTQVQQQIEQAQQQIEEARQRLEHRLEQSIEEAARQNDLLVQLRQDLSERLADQTRNAAARFAEMTSLLELRGNELKLQLTARMDEENGQRGQQISTLGQQISEATSRWQQTLEGFETRLQQWGMALRLKEAQLNQADSSQREQSELTAKNLKREIDRVFEKQQQVSTELVLQGERLVTLLAEARKRLPAPFDEAQLRAIASEEDHKLDAFYASFDEQFRGSREEIMQRLKVYLPIIKHEGIGTELMPLLDVGCGRGEWLELLREEHFHAGGVDSNRILVEWCRDRGLEVAEDDLIDALHQLPDESLGAVTGFHIIEHLPIETLVEFLNQAVRVLKPGGAVIFETPNPQNVLVGSCNFYFDPTHRNPLPSQVTKFLLESRGFVRVEILNLNPSDDTPVDETSELARRFNKYFYGPMDYAVVGFRP